MPARLPKLCVHTAKRRWYVRVRGEFRYLGSIDEVSESEAESARLQVLQQATTNKKSARRSLVTVSDVILEYLTQVVDVRYRRQDGSPTHEMVNQKTAFRPLNRVYGDTLAARFDGQSLEALQRIMAGDNWKTPTERARATSRPWCCSQINKHIGRVKRMFRWAAGRKMVPAELVAEHALVEPLRPGQHGTTEPDDVSPVPIQVIEATLPKLTKVVADMVRLQLLTGARPGEVCALTPDQIDRTGERISQVTRGQFRLPAGCWAIVPSQHKTRHRGKARVIPVGPQAVAVLAKYLDRPGGAPCFSPRENREAFDAARRAGRQTPLTPSQAKRVRKARPRRKAGDQYTTTAYAQSVRKAARKAGQPHWHPHQLRHTAATLLAHEFGPEVARTVCGHSTLSATGIYVERDLKAAFAAIEKVG